VFLLDLRRRATAPNAREVLYKSLQRVGTLVEHEIVRQLALACRDLGVGPNVRGIYNRRVKTGLHAVVKEHRVENASSFGSKAEADVRNAEYGGDARKLALDEADSFYGLLARVDPLSVAR